MASVANAHAMLYFTRKLYFAFRQLYALDVLYEHIVVYIIDVPESDRRRRLTRREPVPR